MNARKMYSLIKFYQEDKGNFFTKNNFFENFPFSKESRPRMEPVPESNHNSYPIKRNSILNLIEGFSAGINSKTVSEALNSALGKSMLFFLFLVISPFLLRAGMVENSKQDGCTVNTIYTVTDVTNPGCSGGSISFTPQTSETYTCQITTTGSPSVLVYSEYYLIGTNIAQLPAGNYTLNIVTENSCTSTDNFTIGQPSCETPVFNITPNDVSVFGMDDGWVNFIVTGFPACEIAGITLGYNYLLEKSGSSFSLSGEVIDLNSSPGVIESQLINLPAGNYVLKINKNNGTSLAETCIATANFTINEPPCDIFFTGTVTNSTANSCNNGSIVINISGNTLNNVYEVYISNPNVSPLPFYAIENNGSGTFSLLNPSPGNYQITITNGVPGNICSYTETFSVTEPPCNLNISGILTQNISGPSCNNGSAEISLSGKTCDGTYYGNLFLNGNFLASYYPTETTESGTASLSNLSPGNYTFSISNYGYGCTDEINFTITEPACNIAITQQNTSNPTTGSNNGSMYLSISGEACGDTYYYELFLDGNLYSSGFETEEFGLGNVAAYGLPPGNYSVWVYSGFANPCNINTTFTLVEEPCNFSINNLVVTTTDIVNGCNTGSVNFNLSGSTSAGQYSLLINKDGNYYNFVTIGQTGTITPYELEFLEAGFYEITLDDAGGSICPASESFTINENLCDIQISNPIITEISTQTGLGGIEVSLSGETCAGYYHVNLFESGNLITSQPVPSTNPVFNYQGIPSGIYQIQAFSGDNIGNGCFDEYGFLLLEPCNMGSSSVQVDTSAGTCGIINATISAPGATDPTKLYICEISNNGGPWAPIGTSFGSSVGLSFTAIGLQNGSYQTRTGPVVIIDQCNTSSSFSVNQEYCDASLTSVNTVGASNGCESGSATINFYDPVKCGGVYSGKLYKDGNFIQDFNFSAPTGNISHEINHLSAGNYDFNFYTVGNSYASGTCPLSGSFEIADLGCNLSLSNFQVAEGCVLSEISATINGNSCINQPFDAFLFKDGLLFQSNTFSSGGNPSTNLFFSSLTPGNYNLKVYANQSSSCFAEETFTVNPPTCNLSSSNLVVTPTSAGNNDGAFSFDINGTSCAGLFSVSYSQNGVYINTVYANQTGSLTPFSVNGLPAGTYQIIINNGFCDHELNLLIETNTAGCNLLISNITANNPTSTGGTDGSVNFNIVGNSCNGSYAVQILSGATLINSYNLPFSGSNTPASLSGLAAGNYQIVVNNGCSASGNPCSANGNFSLFDPLACNLSIGNLSVTHAGGFKCQNGSASFTVSGNTPSGQNLMISVTKDTSIYSFNTTALSGNLSLITLNGLGAGNYQISLNFMGGGSCSDIETFTISQPDCQINLITQPILVEGIGQCTNGLISFLVQGTQCAPVTATLVNTVSGVVYGTQNVLASPNSPTNYSFAGFPAGNYEISISSEGGCSDSENFTFGEEDCNIEIINVTPISNGCNPALVGFNVIGAQCGSTNQVAVLDMAGNMINSQAWSDGATLSFNNLAPGDYQLLAITNYSSPANYCGDTVQFSIPPFDCNIQIVNVTPISNGCNPGLVGFNVIGAQCGSTNQVAVLDMAGNMINSQAWSDGATLSFSNLAPGDYQLLAITNYSSPANYCGDTVQFSIPPFDCNIQIVNVTPISNGCNPGLVGFNVIGAQCGSTNQVAVLDMAGNMINSQAWSDGATLSFSNLAPGDYQLLAITNYSSPANYCGDTVQFSILPFDCNIQIVNVTPISNGCNPGLVGFNVIGAQCGSTNQVAVLDMAGNMINSQAWSDGATLSFSNLAPGDYQLLAITNYSSPTNYCGDTVQFSIPPFNCNIQIVNVTPISNGCNPGLVGFNVIGAQCGSTNQVAVLDMAGNMINSQSWSDGATLSFNNLAPGDYQLLAITNYSSPANYCGDTVQFSIPPFNCNIQIVNVTPISNGCNNGLVGFNVIGAQCGSTNQVAVLDMAGNMINSQAWSDGATLSFNNLAPGDYQLLAITNYSSPANYCGDTVQFSIPPYNCNIQIVNVTPISNGCNNGLVGFNVIGAQCGSTNQVAVLDMAGNMINSQAWSDGATLSFNNLAPGDYQLLAITNYSSPANYCGDTVQFSIPPFNCNIQINNITPTTTACNSGSVSFSVTGNQCGSTNQVAVLDMAGNLIYAQAWTDGTAITFSNIAPGNYQLLATTNYISPANFCGDTAIFTINNIPCDLAISGNSVSPSGGNDGIIAAEVAGTICGNPTWLLEAEIGPGNYVTLTTISGITFAVFENLAPGNYRVTAGNTGNSCSYSILVTVPFGGCSTNPVISASGTTICPGETIILNSNYLTGNEWSNGGNSFNTTITSPGTYTLTVTESNGCTGVASITINPGTACVPLTQLRPADCGKMNFTLTGIILANAVPGATKYEFQIWQNGVVVATKLQTSNQLSIASVNPPFQWGNQYSIKVRAHIGANIGPYGNACDIGFVENPAITGIPVTQLNNSTCGRLNYTISNSIGANPVALANQYQFEFSQAGVIYAIRNSSNQYCALASVSPALQPGQQYQVRVRAVVGGVAGNFGPYCTIGLLNSSRFSTQSENPTLDLNDNEQKTNSDTPIEMNAEITLSPNPFAQVFKVEINSENLEELFEISVFNAAGQLMDRNWLHPFDQITFGDNYPTGIYYIRAIGNRGFQKQKKVIKTQ